jgi:hypothetical protein
VGDTGQPGKDGSTGPAGHPGAAGPGTQLSIPQCVVESGRTVADANYTCRGSTFTDALSTAYWASHNCNATGLLDPTKPYQGCVGPPGLPEVYVYNPVPTPGEIKPVPDGACQMYWKIKAEHQTKGTCLYQRDLTSNNVTCTGTSYCAPNVNTCKSADATICSVAWT